MFTSFSGDPRSDLFRVYLPTEFLVPDILAKYDEYLKKHPQIMSSMEDILYESIVEVQMPSIGYNPLESQAHNTPYSTSTIHHMDSKTSALDRSFTISFRHTEAYLTYFCLLEHYVHHFNSEKTSIGTFALQTTLSTGEPIYTVNYTNVLMIGMPELELSYSNSDRSFGTFSVTFYFSSFYSSFELPKLSNKFK